jgi:hypothetical protein
MQGLISYFIGITPVQQAFNVINLRKYRPNLSLKREKITGWQDSQDEE